MRAPSIVLGLVGLVGACALAAGLGAAVTGCSLDGLTGKTEPPADPATDAAVVDASPAPVDGGGGDAPASACGAVGQKCCSDGCNGAGALCASGTCVACGGLDQPCCANDACSTELECGSGSCKKGCVGRVAAGDAHTCAVRTDGALFCWGNNDSGQLGLGATGAAVAKPTAVSALPDVVAVGAGDVNTCAVAKGGALHCWGNNYSGSLGLGATDSNPHPAPVAVPGMTDAVEVSLAYVHTCARKGDLGVYCWGNNGAGQVGNGLTGAPVPSPFKTSVLGTAIAAGNAHTCAVLNTGAVSCWGYNAYGQIGNGATGAPVTTPTPVAGGRAYTKVAAGSGHSCAIATNGDVYCWGENGSGQLGVGGGGSSSSPVKVTGPTAKKIAAAGSFTCYVGSDDALYCMGANDFGELGDGTTDDRKVATKAAIPVPVVDVAAGLSHACAVDRSGFLWCMGRNVAGQLGLGAVDASPHPTPKRVPIACP
jgi:alpha-tubulin suppressor-like RCC1 family protein